MRDNAHLIVERVSRAIETVLESNGKVRGEEIFSERDLSQIAEAMARKIAEPAKYSNIGFHNTSFQHSKLRQYLDSDPAGVMLMLAGLATTGEVRMELPKCDMIVKVDTKSLALDLESRLASDHLTWTLGIRDAAGQLWDLLLTQLYWDHKSTASQTCLYTQEKDPKVGSTGEKLFKVDSRTHHRYEVLYMGSMLSLSDAVELNKILEGHSNDLLVHDSIGRGLDCSGVSTAEELKDWFREYHKRTKRPAQIAVFAGMLPGSSGTSNGHDLHIITVQASPDCDLFFAETRWGHSHDIHLNGIEPEELLHSMRLPSRPRGERGQPYDSVPPKERVINPSYPIRKSDRSPQSLSLEAQALRLLHREKVAHSNPYQEQTARYNREIEMWESERAEHVSVFGESVPFDKPRPDPPVKNKT